MKVNKFSLIFTFAFLFSLLFFSSVAIAYKDPGKNDIELKVSFRTHIANAYIEKYTNATVIPIIYGNKIYKGYDGTVDHKLYRDYLKKTITRSTDFLILDWEGAPYKNLVDVNAAPDFKIINSYIEAVKIAKDYGNFDIGYYGFPSRSAMNNKRIDYENKKLRRIYKNIDVVSPSLYISRKSIHHDYVSESSERVNKILHEFCGLKKIYLFVYHRWHPKSHWLYKDKLIPKEIFRSYVNRLINAQVQGCGIDGLIFWGADFQWRKKKDAIKNDIKGDFEMYVKNVLKKYIDIIDDEISKKSYSDAEYCK